MPTLIHSVGDGHEDTKFAEHLRKEILSELCMVMARSSVNPTPNRAKVRPPKKRERNHGLNDDAYEPDISSSEERAPKRRGCVGAVNRDLNFCRDLIHRMLSHGYWARFVGPFKKPVDPDLERIPDYFKVIKRPIDLSTIKRKMDGDAYINAKGFEEDIRQMFQNCYTYWTETDAMFKFCKGFEKAFDKEWVKIKTNPLLGGSEEPEL
jgi:hypothetical protein